MKLPAIVSFAAALVAIAACEGLPHAGATPTPPPAADLSATYADTKGSFYLGLDQTLLVWLPNAWVHNPQVLVVTGHFADATLLKAVAVGRTTVLADVPTTCTNECNVHQPLQIAVVVVNPADLQQGVTITEQDHPWEIHMRAGEHFVIALSNPPSGPAWANLVPGDSAVLVPDQPAAATKAGIRGWFHAGQPGRTALTATGPPGSLSFGFVVFA